MLLSALIFGAATTFGPGTVDDFALSLATATAKNAVVVTAQERQLPHFRYDAASADALSTSVSKGARLTMAPGTDPVFSDAVYVGAHFEALVPNLPAAPSATRTMPEGSIAAGKVTLQTNKGKPVTLQGIADAKWSRQVQVDYLMRDLVVSASVKDMPERDFLGAVAKAAGGFLTADDQGYKLSYDVEQLRARVVRTLKPAKVEPPRQVMDVKREFYSAVVGVLPQDVLLEVFQKPDITPRLDVLPNTELATLSIAYIGALEALQAAQVADSGTAPVRRRPGRANGPAVPSNILSRVDNRSTVHLRLNANGIIVLSVPVIQGRRSRYIDM